MPTSDCDTFPYRLPVPDAITRAVAHAIGNTHYDARTYAESITDTIRYTIAHPDAATEWPLYNTVSRRGAALGR